MNEGRTSRAWASINSLARTEGTVPTTRHACSACVQALRAAGAGVSLIRGAELREPAYATDPRSEELDELQFTLGQGPAVDASANSRPVLVGDLSTDSSRSYWPMFAPASVERGIYGTFAFPIALGAARLGVLTVYRQAAGYLGESESADGLVFADALLVLALDDRGGVPAGLVYSDDGFAERRAEVHQAAGMMSVQLGIAVSDALARLRAFAFVEDRRLANVAGDIVARRLRFHPDGGDSAPRDGHNGTPRDGAPDGDG